MIFNRLPLIRFIFGNNDAAAADVARRWRRAAIDEPELVNDLIRLGGVLSLPPERMVDGQAAPDPVDPIRMARDEGKRMLAIEFLALCGVNYHELNQLMENNDEY